MGKILVRIIYAFTYSRGAESSWLLNHILFSLVNQPCYVLITQKETTKKTLSL